MPDTTTHETTYDLDANGNRIKHWTPAKGWVTASYNAQDQLTIRDDDLPVHPQWGP